jgi:glycosyltransferase involved in cell wall biosynthesis
MLSPRVALVIPAYRVRELLPKVVRAVPPIVGRIFVIDDACPEASGKHLISLALDSRVEVLFHEENCGVGAAVMTGYRSAIDWGAEYVVRIDGDNQMNPSHIEEFIRILASGQADYVKGNRFFYLQVLAAMPMLRLIGNIILSFVAKGMSGYWNIMDPTNGFTAANVRLLEQLPFEKLAKRYFFESDVLYHLALLRAVVADVPVAVRYEDETSSLNILHVAITFPFKYLWRTCKRIFFNYFLRDFNVFSLLFVAGVCLLLFGTIFGSIHWYQGVVSGIPATTGTVMVAALPVILGFQLLLSALLYDTTNVPKNPISKNS